MHQVPAPRATSPGSAPTVTAVARTVDVLGESPVWSEAEQALYWVDIRGRTIRRLDAASGLVATMACPETVGCVALAQRGGLVVAIASGFHHVDFAAASLTLIAHPEAHLPGNRYNDGRCDRAGNLCATTMRDDLGADVGSLYRLDASGGCVALLCGLAVPNGIAFSPDGGTMYYADTFRDRVYAYGYDGGTAPLGAAMPFADTSSLGGHPDGATVDAEGFLWIALHGAGRVARFAPDGRLDRVVDLPVSQPTSCCFGGAGLATLLVTTASQRLTPRQREEQPLAGCVLAVEGLGVAGLPEPIFAGCRHR